MCVFVREQVSGPMKGECTVEVVSARAWHSLAAWTLALVWCVAFLLWLSLVERKPMATWQREGLLAGSEAMGNEAHCKVGHGAREARGDSLPVFGLRCYGMNKGQP